MESKNIERLYQEKLKDLEITPPTAVWSKIEKSLATPKKSKKSFIWYWTTAGSVAALFILGFFLYQPKQTELLYSGTLEKETPKKVSKALIKEKSIANTTSKKNTFIPILEKETTVLSDKEKKHSSLKNKSEFKHNIAKRETNKHTSPQNKPQQELITKHLTIKENKTSKKEIGNYTTRKLTNPNILETTKSEDLKKEKLNKPPRKDLLAEIETPKEILKNKTIKKPWSIAPTLIQYYSGTFSDNSSIDPRLDNSKKSGQRTTSFGLNVAYQASKRFKIKTGIHKIDLLQTNTSDLITSSDFNAISNEALAINKPDQIISNSSDEISLGSEIEKINDSNTNISGKFEQNISYIEVPIELSFNIYKTKQLEFNFSGGLSTLFLTKNNLQITRQNNSFSNGESSNLNSLNFSFNLGTDVEYHFSEQWFFNLSPNLKIQTQTFNKFNNNPYLIGVSTGLNYKF